MRGKPAPKRHIASDHLYNSPKVERFINYTMHDGKKNTARRVVYGAFAVMKEKAKAEDPLELFEQALRNVGPTVEVRSRRVGGANYQVPREVRPERRMALAMRWILAAARSRKGKPMSERLAEELMLAARSEGDAVRKRENVHKMAEANKAFAHFSW